MKSERAMELEKETTEINKLTEILASELCAMSLSCKLAEKKCENCNYARFYVNLAIHLYKKGVRVKEK